MKESGGEEGNGKREVRVEKVVVHNEVFKSAGGEQL